MAGCRAFTPEEVRAMQQAFRGRYAARDKALFVVGIKAGFRISELLSLQVKDVMQYGKVVDRVEVKRRHMKGGGKPRPSKPRPADHHEQCRCTACCPTPRKPTAQSRSVPLHPEARAALSVWLERMLALFGEITPETPVFCSRVRRPDGSRRAIARETAWRILEAAVAALELAGKIGCHSMRKTFAMRVYEQVRGDLRKVQKALGHKHINSTMQYLEVDHAEVEAGILAA